MPTRWTLPDQASALQWCAHRNEQGIRCILDVLGRYNRDETLARESYAAYIKLAEQVKKRGLKASFAVKPSILGGVISRNLTMELVRGIGEKAGDLGIGFELDMEGQRTIDLTLLIAEESARSGLRPTIALQSYLKRTPKDIERMLDAGVKIRLVKGAYTGDIADFNIIQEVFKDLVEQILERDVPFCIATHDPDLLEWSQDRISDRDILEFSFLKGLADETKERLVWDGWKVAEYVPFGPHKEGYETRRKTYLRRLDELGRLPAP
ncbi:MAG: hypothetical protein GXX95_01580 [Methanomassiliicoccus sp.]|nr:hypothetical protein [Methanomassiliicoccus sp.]